MAPLADCTMGAIQEANRANNGINANIKTIRKRYTHNPYLRTILTPVSVFDGVVEKKRHEPNPDAPAFVPSGVSWNMCAPGSYDETLYMNGMVGETNGCGMEYYYSQPMISSHTNPSETHYQTLPEPAESANTSSVVDKAVNLSNSTVSCGNTGTSVVSTPIKRSNNLYKMYVDGRPKVVRGVTFAEVKVELRLGSEVFLVNDVPHIFGVILKAEDLINRHVIVEGDRGEDLGLITAIVSSEPALSKSADVEEEEEEREKGEKRPLRVLREALPEEVESFHSLDHMEEEALRFCKAAINSLNLRTPLEVQRAVFQFDRKKLTFTYCSDTYVEFKALLRALNRQYQCRIWMHQLNWEVNCRQRRHAAVDNHRKSSNKESRKRGGANKDAKRNHEADKQSQ
ncbi:PSP1 family protein [Trypanosoma theileri]|uniref:PSP1 family protein n=1 Tax=Trypanosoma theileri TaxID=67003 RepID=A0A1X0NQL8_9TRYP|nr:PSP1 family protein [Trypanosoma theileri]ORC86818.1 PSP1 family protein [Trypanosoma theileri]